MMPVKYFLFKHIEKLILGMVICYLIYTIIYTFITTSLKTQNLDSKLLSLSTIIDRKLKMSMPQPLNVKRKEAEQLALRFTTPPAASLLLRPYLSVDFASDKSNLDITTKDLLKKPEMQISSGVEGAQGTTEFILKGGTADMALIQVRKFYRDKWWAESFTVGRGEIIGREKKIGAETVDFHTYCRLTEIAPFAPKPFFTRKTVVLRNEKNEFLGVSQTEEKHMIPTSQVVFKDKKGESHHVWIGELVKLGTETVAVSPVTHTMSTH